ncbi:MAG TPA: Gfo/Idh/MocA family oxidoreductase [Armatimonadota bacterium]|nr:Gfo/Idh/MocA family oxidoreductase [Armatimonadota bacterium]
MGSTALRVGIVGVSGIARGKHLPGLAKLDTVRLVAFCDLSEERAQAGAAEFGVPHAQAYTDYRRMLDEAQLDVVHVCTANKTHAEISIAALEAGCHVMCEKPMAKTAAEARAMVAAAQRTGKKLTIGYQNRFRADAQYLKRVCMDGGLGDIYFAKAHAIRRRAVPTFGLFMDQEQQGGGPLIDIGTHSLDLALWFMDNYSPVSVAGTVYHKLNSREHAANAWESWDPKKFTMEDSAFGFIRFANGASVMLESSWALNTRDVREAECTLCGTEAGADMCDGLHINGEHYGCLYDHHVEFKRHGVDYYAASNEQPGDLEAKTWIDAIINDTEPLVKPQQALVVTEILEAIYTSSATGSPVTYS